MSEKPTIIPIQKILEQQDGEHRTDDGARTGLETPNIIPIERVLERQDREDNEGIRRILEGIKKLEEGKKRYEEWREIALEQGDTKSADQYELEMIEIELLIIKGEALREEADQIQCDRWQRYFQHAMEADREREASVYLEDIGMELEVIDDLIASMSEEENSRETDEKIKSLRERREKLENDRAKYSE
ncbi:MAG: hypothetical protein HGA31_04850 [Candidatus Moranbacteria bacterium]|nr:hypothetical protein [Candidatus Moranbacteria bacterium]